jgi:membrane protein
MAAMADLSPQTVQESPPSSLRHALTSSGKTALRTLHIYGAIDGEQRAASFAYYVLFSLFPLFALLLTVGSQFLNSQEIIDGINSFLPLDPSQKQFIWDSVTQLEQARGGVGIASVVVLLWCSLRFFQALVRGVNRAWHTIEFPWWQLPLKNLLMVCIVSSALFAGLLAPALLQGARNALVAAETLIRSRFPDFNLPLISSVIDLSRYAIGGLVLFYAFSMLYKLAPRRKVLFSQVWLAALLVTLSLQACQVAFVNYLPRIMNYGIYGAVGLMMLLLLWVYVSGMIIILGGCLCAAMGLEEESHPGDIPTTPASS